MRRLLAALGAGLAGAATVTLLEELGHRVDARAPRLDLLGERALSVALARLGSRAPRPRKLRRMVRAGELLSSALYFAALFAGRPRAWRRGALGGSMAGLGVVALASALDLRDRSQRPSVVSPLALAWYVSAGLAASAVYARLAPAVALPMTQSLPLPRSAL